MFLMCSCRFFFMVLFLVVWKVVNFFIVLFSVVFMVDYFFLFMLLVVVVIIEGSCRIVCSILLFGMLSLEERWFSFW